MIEQYDLIFQGGKVFDAENKIFITADVGIHNGVIAAIAPTLPTDAACAIHILNGKMLLPGLIDFHTHIYWGATPLGINPDKQTRGANRGNDVGGSRLRGGR